MITKSNILLKGWILKMPKSTARCLADLVAIEMSGVGMKLHSLYGDHMSVYVPEDARDISAVREVPDNQEVFTHPVTDQSIIFEVLEAVQDQDEEAVRVHFQDLASCNDAMDAQTEVISVEQIPKERLNMAECDSAWLLSGKQLVSKFNEQSKNNLNIYMGLFRLAQFDTDILVSFNDPTNISLDSSSHHAVPTSAQPWNTEQFQQILCSLTILNTDLFGGEEEMVS